MVRGARQFRARIRADKAALGNNYLNTEPGFRVLRAITINAISNMPA